MDNFFIQDNRVNYLSEEVYQQTTPLIVALEAFSRMTYQSIYIIDYYKKCFLYVSENPLFLCGLRADEVREMGYIFYLNYVPKEDLAILLEINKAGFMFFNDVPIEDRMKYTISYDFHISDGSKKTLVNHKLTPLTLTPDGNIWLSACVVSLSSHQESGHIEIRKIGDSNYWTYSMEGQKWKQKENLVLTEREKEILALSVQGYTMSDIANKLFVGIDTVKFHKRKLFEKLNVKNISEAISIVSNNKMM